MKKVLSTFLILCMLVLFIACSSNSGDESTLNPTTMEKPAETNTPDIYYEPDELPDGMNFDTTIKILTQRTAVNELSAESLNSDVINDSIYNREVFVEDRLGVEIEIIGAEIRTELEKQMVSDEDNFQIVSNPVFTLSDALFYGYYTDLHTVEHLDFDKPWWPRYFTDAAEIDGCLYFASGSLARSLIQSLWAIYLNKTLTESYSVNIPEMVDIYALVESGD